MASKITADIVAKYIVAYLGEYGELCTNLRLQKLLYYVQAWYLVNTNTPLFSDEFEAWVHGPVIPSIYHDYKRAAVTAISIITPITELRDEFTKEQVELIETILQEYMQYTPYSLELMTHNEDPWKIARGNCAPTDSCNNKISLEDMKQYYGKRI